MTFRLQSLNDDGTVHAEILLEVPDAERDRILDTFRERRAMAFPGTQPMSREEALHTIGRELFNVHAQNAYSHNLERAARTAAMGAKKGQKAEEAARKAAAEVKPVPKPNVTVA